MDSSLSCGTLLYLDALCFVFRRTATEMMMMMKMRTAMATMETGTPIARASDGIKQSNHDIISNDYFFECIIRIHIINCFEQTNNHINKHSCTTHFSVAVFEGGSRSELIVTTELKKHTIPNYLNLTMVPNHNNKLH